MFSVNTVKHALGSQASAPASWTAVTEMHGASLHRRHRFRGVQRGIRPQHSIRPARAATLSRDADRSSALPHPPARESGVAPRLAARTPRRFALAWAQGLPAARQRFGVLQPSGAFRRPKDVRKRRRTGALQDAAASLHHLESLSPHLAKTSTAWSRPSNHGHPQTGIFVTAASIHDERGPFGFVSSSLYDTHHCFVCPCAGCLAPG